MLSDEQLLAVKERIEQLTALMDQAVEAALLSPEEAHLVVVRRLASQISTFDIGPAVEHRTATRCCDDSR
jgi:hypothetical protein